MAFWSKDQFRKLKWEAKRLKQISEDKMMKAFRDKFGPPEEVMIALGNWSQNKPMSGTEPTKTKGFRGLFKRNGYATYLVDEFRTSKCCYNCGQFVKQKFLDVSNPKVYQKQRKPDQQTVQKQKRNESNNQKRRRRKREKRRANRTSVHIDKAEASPPCQCDGCKAKTDEERTREKRTLKEKVKCHGLTRCDHCRTFWNRDLNGALNIGRKARAFINGEACPSYMSRENSHVGEGGPEDNDQAESASSDDFEMQYSVEASKSPTIT
jgi:hypothetical protein